MQLFRSIYFMACICLVSCYLQELTLYSEPDSQGDVLRFRYKYPNLSDYQFFLPQVKSYCVTGFWYGFSGMDYTGILATGLASASGNPVCGNLTFANTLNSLRCLGPPEDATLPSVSLYSGGGSAYGGNERTITGLSGTNFGFVPTGMFITGRSSWTTFVNENFTGNSTCFRASGNHYPVFVGGMELKSVVQGCNAKLLL